MFSALIRVYANQHHHCARAWHCHHHHIICHRMWCYLLCNATSYYLLCSLKGKVLSYHPLYEEWTKMDMIRRGATPFWRPPKTVVWNSSHALPWVYVTVRDVVSCHDLHRSFKSTAVTMSSCSYPHQPGTGLRNFLRRPTGSVDGGSPFWEILSENAILSLFGTRARCTYYDIVQQCIM